MAHWGRTGSGGSFLVASSLFSQVQRSQWTHLSNLTADFANFSKSVISNTNLTTKKKKKRHYLILLRDTFFLQLFKNQTFDVWNINAVLVSPRVGVNPTLPFQWVCRVSQQTDLHGRRVWGQPTNPLLPGVARVGWVFAESLQQVKVVYLKMVMAFGAEGCVELLLKLKATQEWCTNALNAKRSITF